jgi:hypothetical protein
VTDMATRVESDRPVLSVLRRMRPDEMDQAISGQVDRLRTLADFPDILALYDEVHA